VGFKLAGSKRGTRLPVKRDMMTVRRRGEEEEGGGRGRRAREGRR